MSAEEVKALISIGETAKFNKSSMGQSETRPYTQQCKRTDMTVTGNSARQFKEGLQGIQRQQQAEHKKCVSFLISWMKSWGTNQHLFLPTFLIQVTNQLKTVMDNRRA